MAKTPTKWISKGATVQFTRHDGHDGEGVVHTGRVINSMRCSGGQLLVVLVGETKMGVDRDDATLITA